MLFKIWAFGKLVLLTASLSCYLTKFNPLQKYQEPCARPCDHHWAPEQEDSFVLAGDQGIFQMEWYGLHAQFGRLPYLVMSGKYGYTRLIWQFFFDWLISWLMNILVNIFGILAPRSSPLRHPSTSWWTSPPTPPPISKWVLDIKYVWRHNFHFKGVAHAGLGAGAERLTSTAIPKVSQLKKFLEIKVVYKSIVANEAFLLVGVRDAILYHRAPSIVWIWSGNL